MVSDCFLLQSANHVPRVGWSKEIRKGYLNEFEGIFGGVSDRAGVAGGEYQTAGE
jgi:hypothetical protein